jgi:hypothetical protein
MSITKSNTRMLEGTLGVDKLSATGTKDATTFLRGDNTFAAPAAAASNSPTFLATSSNTSIVANTNTVVINGTEEYDSNSLYNNSTGRFTVTEATAGLYYIYAGVGYPLITASRIQCNIWKNGYATSEGFRIETHASNGYPALQISGVFNLSAGDYVEVTTQQNSSNTAALSGEEIKNYFGGFKLA